MNTRKKIQYSNNLAVIIQNYYSPSVAIKILGITDPQYRYLLKSNYFTDFIKYKGSKWVLKKEINNYREILMDLKENYINSKEAANYLNISVDKFLKCLKIFSGNIITHSNTFWIKKTDLTNPVFVKKSKLRESSNEIKRMRKDYYDTVETSTYLSISTITLYESKTYRTLLMAKKQYGKTWFDKEQVKKLHNFKKKYSNLTIAANYLNIGKAGVYKLLDYGYLRTSLKLFGRIWFLNNELIKCKTLLTLYITKKDAMKLLKVTKWELDSAIRKGSIRIHQRTNSQTVFRKDIIAYKKYLDSRFTDVDLSKNPLKAFLQQTNNFNKAHCNSTYNIYIQFFISKLNNSHLRDKRKIKSFISSNVNFFKKLSAIISKELHLYNDPKLSTLLTKSNVNQNFVIFLQRFISFCRETRFEKFGHISNISIDNSIKPKKEKRGYTRLEWYSAIRYLSNTQQHIQEALEIPKYALLWLHQ